MFSATPEIIVTPPTVLHTYLQDTHYVLKKMEACCSFKHVVGSSCGFNAKDRKRPITYSIGFVYFNIYGVEFYAGYNHTKIILGTELFLCVFPLFL